MTTQRFFNTHQRLAVYAASQGACAICSQPLTPGFHADHVVPFRNGGPTDIVNSQALCPGCNLAKAAGPNPVPSRLPDSLPPLMPWTKPLRAWQEKGLIHWRRRRTEGSREALVTATPGAGKSLLAVRIMHDELVSGRADRIVVAVPSQILKRQWAAVAQAHGLRLAASWGNDAVVMPPDVHGVIVTYAQVARLPEALRVQCAHHRVLACFDEIHHGGYGLAWGEGIREAFENAAARLCLSGTAWRGDAATIPFVRYDAEGQSVADISYNYAEALADQTVREVYFFTQGGQVKWLDGQGEHEVTFEDDMHPERMSKRLRAALDISGHWLPAVMRQAADALEQIRLTHPKGKGLIVCMDAAHARGVADLTWRVTGEKPVLALSDDPDAGEALTAFRTGKERWLVVCKMAGEGYDAPDLRVCLWATNLMTELYFRQVVGRIIRMVPGLDYQDGQVFLPSDPRLLAMAQALLAERAQALGGPQQDREERVPGIASGRGRPLFVPLASSASAGIVVSGGTTIPVEALEKAHAFKTGKPALAHLPAHFIAAIFNHLEPHQVPNFPVPQILPCEASLTQTASNMVVAEAGQGEAHNEEALADAATYDDLRIQKRRLCSRLAATLARATGEAIEAVHRACHQELGVRQGEASLVDLERKENLLVARLQQLHEN